MMEFTFDGVVRHGFGFYNPNHAAALICAFFPFLWAAWLKWTSPLSRIPVVAANLLLLIALMLTFSRTGVLVLCLEAVLFRALQKKIHWKSALVFLAAFLLILLTSGILARFSLDRAITNRPAIWMAGVSLFAANPMGVGAGNSGLLAAAFLLPDGVVCRTLINSHLTLLVEYGIFPGILWFGLILYALFCGWRYPALWCSFLGLTVSASAATIFDWEILFDFTGYGTLSVLNFILSWILFLLYCCIFAVICMKNEFRWKIAGAAAGGVFCIVLVFFLLGSVRKNVPRVSGEFIVRQGNSTALALYDDSWSLKEVLAFLPDGYCLPLRSWEKRSRLPIGNWDKIFLFGKCAASKLYKQAKTRELVFVSPPDYATFPENLKKIYLKRFGEENVQDLAEENNLEIIFY